MSDELPIIWAESQTVPHLQEAFIDGSLVAWIEKRPDYCDRGHWSAMTSAALIWDKAHESIGHQDGFPRYYMRLSVAKQEMTEWLKWRLWKVDIG